MTPLQDDILLCLKEEQKSLAGLRTRIDARDTSVLHAIKELESKKLVRKDTVTHSYSVTSIGFMYAVMLGQVHRATDALSQMEDFWLQHDVSGIPEHLLIGISSLQDATVVRTAPSDLDAIHTKYLELLRSSRRVDGVSPIFHPDFAKTTADILSQGADIRLIVTKEVLDKIKEEVRLRDLARYARRIMINRDLEVRVRDSLKIALTVTESFLSLGLFAVDGTYDYSADLMSSHPQALEWGKRLFEHYHASSERVKFAAVL